MPQSLNLVIGKCLAKLPAERYQTAKELYLDLQRIKAGKAVLAAPKFTAAPSQSRPDRTSKPLTQRLLLPFLLLTVLAVSITGFYFLQNELARQSRALRAKENKAKSTKARFNVDITHGISELRESKTSSGLNPVVKNEVEAFLKGNSRKFVSIAF